MEDKNKKLVDELFAQLENGTPASLPKEKPVSAEEQKTVVLSSSADTEETTLRELLNSLASDYDAKLGIGLDLKNKGKIKYTELVPDAQGLPFMAQSLSAALNFSKSLSNLRGITGNALDGIEKEVITPAFVVCAGIVYRIHKLAYVPEITVDDFDTKRVGPIEESFSDTVEHINDIRGATGKQKWIALVCFDICTTLVNVLTSIVAEKVPGFLTGILSMLTVAPVASAATMAYIKSMVATSQMLEKL